jgi:hypothetical protein
MSLINDALKRAKQFQQEQPQAQSVLPLEPSPSAAKPRAGLAWALPVLVILLITVAGMFIVLAFCSTKPPVQVTKTVPISQPVKAIPPPPKLPPSPATATGQTVAVTAPKPPPPPPRALRVQGISYSNTKWQAIVNGATVYVGDNVNGFRVALISRNNVSFIAPDGSQKTLALGE